MDLGHRLIVGCFHLLEVLFFTGLAGCSLVVLISWISIFKSGFSRDDDASDLHSKVPTKN